MGDSGRGWFWVLLWPVVTAYRLAHRFVKWIIAPSLTYPGLESRTSAWLERIIGIGGILLVGVSAVVTDLSGTPPEEGAVFAAFVDLVVSLFYIAGLIVLTGVLFVVLARPEHRPGTVRAVLRPIASVAAYAGVITGLTLFAPLYRQSAALAEWVPEGPLLILVSVVMVGVGLFALAVLSTAMTIGAWYGSYYMFRAADAHPLFPVVVGAGLGVLSAVLLVLQLVEPGSERDPVALGILVFGPTSQLLLCAVEAARLLRPPCSVSFREPYPSVWVQQVRPG